MNIYVTFFCRSKIPVANSITAMEVWLLACIVLVFLTLVEYAVILREAVLSKRQKKKNIEPGHDYLKRENTNISTADCSSSVRIITDQLQDCESFQV